MICNYFYLIFYYSTNFVPILLATQCNAWVCGRLAGIAGSNPAGTWIDSCECLVLSEVTASCRSLVRRSPTECFVLECDPEISTVRRQSSHKRKQILYSARPCGAFLQVLYVRRKLTECSTFLCRCIVR